MYKFFSVLVMAAVFYAPVAFAEEATTTSVPPKAVVCPLIKAAISRGVSGGSVLELQNFLASYYGVSTSTIATGFFGPKTHELVMRFQKERGLDAQGLVGPLTRAAIAKACGFAGPAGSSGSTFAASTTPSTGVRPPSCRMRVEPAVTGPNQSVTFSWSSTGADYSVWGSGDKDNANETSRVFTNIASTTKFTLTFYGAGGTVTCAVLVTVPGTATTTPEIKRPPLGTACPAIGWVEPTTSCDGKWIPRFGATNCQIGWQCIGLPPADGASTTPEVPKKNICDHLPQIIPACDGPTAVRDTNGCVISWRCPLASTTPPLIKPPSICPLIAYMPIQCNGSLTMQKDSNGCQTGWRCDDPAPGTGPRCLTPWGGKAALEGQTVPYEPYFSLGRLSKSVVIPLMKCSGGSWLICNYLGESCQAWTPLTVQLKTTSIDTTALSASELAAAFVALQQIVSSALSVFGN